MKNTIEAARSALVICCIALFVLGGCSDGEITAPMAAKKPKELEAHGDVRVDDYFWLRERENPEVISYLEAENAYTESVMAETAGLQQRLYDELKSRINPDDATAPYKHGDYYYYQRFEEDLDYPIYVRRPGSMEADEEILLDVNELAGDEEFFAVSGFQVSPDHSRAMYGVDTVGRRFYTLNFIDLETGEAIREPIVNVTPNSTWASDSETVFYTKQHPETLRWQWIYRAQIGADDSELIYEEEDETFTTYVYKSLSEKFIYISSSATTESEARYIRSDAPLSDPQLFLAREDNHEYSVIDGGDRFFVVSNENAQNFQLFEAPLDDTAKSAWSLVVPHRDNVMINDIEAFSKYLVLWGRRSGLPYFEVIDRASGETHSIDFGEEAYLAYPGSNYEFDSGAFRYGYESMTTPGSDYDHDMQSRERTLVKEREVPGGFDRNQFQTERRFATARDGTKVPVSLVYKKDTVMDGESPLLLHGYGSYGANYDPSFSSSRLSLLDRGFIVAIAHIRGGGEMGRHWYLDGRQFQKMNTFTDYIDVSKFLIEQGYTSPEHLYAEGASAGGLLMGAVLNMAPELYNGALAGVPFVDAITTMLDEEIPLTALEWEEWGDPREKDFYDYMLSYSPYDQVSAQDYPNVLVTTGLHDSQVQYWEPAKWVAKLREYKTDDNILMLKTDMAAGHGGKTGRFQYLEDVAFEYGFLMMLEGIKE
jgi:oligopeptidase B